MKKKKIPMRRCIASGEIMPKKELVRIVRNAEGVAQIDPTGKVNGRGAYITLEPTLVEKAWKNRLFEKQLEIEIPDDFYEELLAYVEHQKARKELFSDGRAR